MGSLSFGLPEKLPGSHVAVWYVASTDYHILAFGSVFVYRLGPQSKVFFIFLEPQGLRLYLDRDVEPDAPRCSYLVFAAM